jgi:polyisoprenyl-teichoic acid--peptidoglycan teichoic acid transferase
MTNVTNQPEKDRIKARQGIKKSRIKRKIFRRIWLMRVLLVSLFATFCLGGILLIRFVFISLGIPLYTSLLVDFATVPPYKILSSDSRTNILILGKGGKGHDAPELTDTILVASISHTSPHISLLSLPRDIWINDLSDKINSVYSKGNEEKPGTGIVLARATTSAIIGKDIHYGIVIDFEGFTRAIDTIGGIDVDVPYDFTDTQFPIAGLENDECNGDTTFACRYETITFTKGTTRMDGITALKFSRSRHAQGDAGTDFARASRQQLIIDAIIRRGFSKEIITNIDVIRKLVDIVKESVETDIDSAAGAIIARRVYDSRNSEIVNLVLPEELLYRPPYTKEYNFLYVFLPVGGTWTKTHEWVQANLHNEN